MTMLVGDKLRRNLLLLGALTIIAEGIFQILISQMSNLYTAVLLFVLVSFAGGIGNACLDTLLMRNIPEGKQATVFGIIHTITNALFGVFMLIAGYLLSVLRSIDLGVIGGSWFIGIGVFAIIIVIKIQTVGKAKKTNYNIEL
ncbi:hypothetical protein LC040_08735 [Bacillus tianshenii]|nr:hypothetical protein LC040_08735 [Bacillus tianshenii]